MDDQNIIELYNQRDQRAITETQLKYGAYCMEVAYRVLQNRQDAEECVNDTYLAVWRSIPPNRPEPLRPYVCRIGRNIALNRLRSSSAQKRSGYEISLEELAGCIPAPCMEDGRALGQTMDAWLDTLNKESRAIFLRRYWFGDSVQDIADAFHMKENAVSVQLNRLRSNLKEYLIKEGYYE